MKVYYIGFFSNENSTNRRVESLAAHNKMKYISNCITNYFDVIVVSPSWSVDGKFLPKEEIVNGKCNEHYFCSLPYVSVTKILSVVYCFFQMFFYSMKRIKSDDVVIVYHSLYLMFFVNILKKIKKINIILQVEEIYSDIRGFERRKYGEIKFINSMTKYIFITEMLAKKLGLEKRKHCVSYGPYMIQNRIEDKFDDNKVHLVYSGIIDKVKNGAFIALDIARYLDKKYVLHIIGFGEERDVKQLKDAIDIINEKNMCQVILNNPLNGNDFIKFLQRCDIGLSTQNSHERFNDTSFPSKIITYMCNGLNVISSKSNSVCSSSIANCIYFYDEIKEVPLLLEKIINKKSNKCNCAIRMLDFNFRKEIIKLISE